jgi:phospholipase/lecithinase/hemolysin
MKTWLFIVALLFSIEAVAEPVNKVVIFGDSLSDNGNLYEYMKHQLPISPPYYQGRFSNGPVWIENVVKHYYPEDSNAHLLNYAFGGAGVAENAEDDEDDTLFTLHHEVDSYLLTHHDQADAQSLFVVWMGANNYLAFPDDPEQSVLAVNQGIYQELERLVSKGATHLMIVTLPDLGHTPAAADFDSVDLLTKVTLQHNALLEKQVEALRLKYPTVQWILYDVNDMFMGAVATPSTYGFTNVTGTCYEAAMDTSASSLSVVKMAANIKRQAGRADACEGYLFFDPIHPTAVAHQYIADECIKLFETLGVVLG